MSIDSSSVHDIVTEIWESMLGLEIAVAVPPPAPPPPHREVCAAVQITGGWEGAVVVACDETVAASFTAVMLGLDDDEPAAESDIHDVMGELANMAGGNLKAVVGREAQLSLPTVVVGSDLDISVPGAAVAVREVYTAGEDRFSITVMAKLDPAVAVAS